MEDSLSDVNTESEQKDREYAPERIVKKRVRSNKIQYLVKWHGYSAAENTWEDEDNLRDCADLLLEFNEMSSTEPVESASPVSKKELGKKHSLREIDTTYKKAEPPKKRQRTQTTDEVGFDYGDKVQDIVGARLIKNVLYLYVLWKEKNICSFVPAEICNKKVPQKVIEFYESRLNFEKPQTDT